MRYMIMMGTVEDLHYIGEGKSLPAALNKLLEDVLKSGSAEHIADLSNSLEALEDSALIEALKEA